MKCKLCDREFNSLMALSKHIFFAHKEFTPQQYYDQFLKKENDGICLTCKKETKSIGIRGYRKHCSYICYVNDPYLFRIRENKKKTRTDFLLSQQSNLCECGCGEKVTTGARFLRGHSNRDLDVKLKKEQTNLEHCGYKNPGLTPEYQNKGIETNRRKRNCDYSMQDPDCRKLAEQTLLRKYNCTHCSHISTFEEKTKKAWENKSDEEIEEINLKRILTYLEKTGFKYPMQNPVIKKQSQQTHFDKTGYTNWSKSPEGKMFLRIKGIREREERRINNEPDMPNIGFIERSFLNELKQYTHYNIIRNDQSFKYIIGRYPDGHIPELKLFIQFDERIHFHNNTCTIYKEDDINCTLELASLGYIVFRVSTRRWKRDKEKVIEDFKSLIKNLSEEKEKVLETKGV